MNISAVADVTIENGANHVIRGTGCIYAPMANLGRHPAPTTRPGRWRSDRSSIKSLAGRLVGQNAVLQLANGASITGGFWLRRGSASVRIGILLGPGVTNEGTLEVFNNSCWRSARAES